MDLIQSCSHSSISSESQEEGSMLFPKTNLQGLNSSLAILKQQYNAAQHSFELINYCFRCHIKQLSEGYNAFRLQQHSQLIEPRISNFYENDCFVDLLEFSKKNGASQLEISALHIPPIPKNIKELLNSIFTKYGYIPSLQRFLLFFPTYLEKHLLVEEQLFESDKIDSKIAYFLALVAAAELGSVYVMARMLKRFLKEGGLMQWFLQGKFPQKYKILMTLNRYLARAPWQITQEMIEQILENGTYHWSKAELAICIQIIAYSHSMSTIALGVGLLAQDESLLHHLNLKTIQELQNSLDFATFESKNESKERLAVMIPVGKEEEDDEFNSDRLSQFKQEIIMNKKTLKKSLRRAEAIDPYMKEIGNQLTNQQTYREINRLLTPLLPPFQLFDKRGEMKNNVIDYSEFNYKFNAYPILHNFTQGIADKIEGLIEYSEDMTPGTIGIERPNHTKQFRKAVRYYSQNLCGYTHHQYDFKNKVASILPMSLKFYIRLLTLSPFHISKQVIKQINHESGQIQCFDLGHIAVLIANTKLSLGLTLAVQAIHAFQL